MVKSGVTAPIDQSVFTKTSCVMDKMIAVTAGTRTPQFAIACPVRMGLSGVRIPTDRGVFTKATYVMGRTPAVTAGTRESRCAEGYYLMVPCEDGWVKCDDPDWPRRIPQSWRCDGADECRNGCDERNCITSG